jgi:hypothetical protein
MSQREEIVREMEIYKCIYIYVYGRETPRDVCLLFGLPGVEVWRYARLCKGSRCSQSAQQMLRCSSPPCSGGLDRYIYLNIYIYYRHRKAHFTDGCPPLGPYYVQKLMQQMRISCACGVSVWTRECGCGHGRGRGGR